MWTVFLVSASFGGSRLFHGSRSKTGTRYDTTPAKFITTTIRLTRIDSAWKRIHSWHCGRLTMSSSTTSYRNLGEDTDNRKVVDVYLYHFLGSNRCCFGSRNWIEDGRPYGLPLISLATWNFMTKKIHEHQESMKQYRRKLYSWFFLVYLISVFSNHLDDFFTLAEDVSLIIQCIVLVLAFAYILYIDYCDRRHKNQVFIPAIHAVIDTLQPQFQEAGYEVVFVVENGCCKVSYGLLRFISLDKNKEQQAAAV